MYGSKEQHIELSEMGAHDFDDLLLIEQEYVSAKKTIGNTTNESCNKEELKKPPF